MRFIRDHAWKGIKVSEVLAEVHCSRSILERRFREHLGRSPQAEICDIRLRRVRQLLAETDWKLPRIAEAVGIDHPEYLSVMFKRQTGRTPDQFRQAQRAGSAEGDPQ